MHLFVTPKKHRLLMSSQKYLTKIHQTPKDSSFSNSLGFSSCKISSAASKWFTSRRCAPSATSEFTTSMDGMHPTVLNRETPWGFPRKMMERLLVRGSISLKEDKMSEDMKKMKRFYRILIINMSVLYTNNLNESLSLQPVNPRTPCQNTSHRHPLRHSA